MTDQSTGELVRFIQLFGPRPPRRADRSVGGTLPVRALRYCEPVTSASTFGWHIFLPQRFRLRWDGHEIFWQFPEMDHWEPLRSIHFPGFPETFDAAAPEHAKGFAPPFLSAGIQPGFVQVWPGSMLSTAPGWSSLVRPVANLARPSGYELFEGIVETDTWFGPLFTNIRLTRTDMAIEFDDDIPFMQVQPLKRGQYDEKFLSRFSVGQDLAALSGEDWVRYQRTVVGPNQDPNRRMGQYAADVRKRCPVHAAD